MVDIALDALWWLAVVLVFLLLAPLLGAALIAYNRDKRCVHERIIEYLSGKREPVRTRQIQKDLRLSFTESRSVLHELELQGAVASEFRADRVIHGKKYGQRYWWATGTSRPHEAGQGTLQFA